MEESVTTTYEFLIILSDLKIDINDNIKTIRLETARIVKLKNWKVYKLSIKNSTAVIHITNTASGF